MRIAYQYNHLSNDAKKIAEKNNKGVDLTSLLYNVDGTMFKHSTTVCKF